MSTSSASLLDAVRAHLARFAPFNEMQPADLRWLVQRLTVDYYPEDAVLLGPGHGVVSQLYIIKQGSVLGEAGDAHEGANLQLSEGECFPLGALLASRPVANVYRAATDTFCYQLPAADFAELMQRSPSFRDFCTRRIAHLLERSQQTIQAEYTRAATAQQSLSTPLASLVRRAPVTCHASDTIESALARMQAENVGSLVIVEGERPTGIFTLHDLLARVALARADLCAPIAQVMTPEPITLPAQASAHEAALAMARHGIRHVLVTDGARFIGVVSEKDLFSVQRVGMTRISLDIRNARQLADLKASAADIRALAHAMVAQGVGAERLTQLISTLNDLLTCRVIELHRLRFDLDDIAFTWLALGSEGRVEQTLATDQDNGIVFRVPDGADAHGTRERLLPFARAVNEALDACGFPLCKGGIMASNPSWCLSVEEWDEAFASWIQRGDAPVLLNASIFFDFRALHGAAELVDGMRVALRQRIGENRLFLRRMTENALANRPPLGVLRDFAVSDIDEHPHSIDLKINGVTPFVDAARIYALAAGIATSNTPARLREVAARWQWDPVQVEGWVEAFFFIQMLRLRLHEAQMRERQPFSNRLDPDTLNDLDRRILKEVLRQARKLQGMLERDFQF